MLLKKSEAAVCLIKFGAQFLPWGGGGGGGSVVSQ